MSRQGICIILFLCVLSLSSDLGRHLYCDSSLIGRNTPTWEVKPPFLPYSQYIYCKYIIKGRGIPAFQQFINRFNLYYSQDFDTFLVFLDVFLDVPSATLRLTPSVFSKWPFPEKNPIGGLRTYFLENPHWNFQVFYFIPGNSRKNKASPQKLHKIVLHVYTPRNIQGLKPRPLEIPYEFFFLDHP